MDSTTKPDTELDGTAIVFALIGAFAAGMMIVLLVALASRNESLRRELIAVEAKAAAAEQRPLVLVVKGGGHE